MVGIAQSAAINKDASYADFLEPIAINRVRFKVPLTSTARDG